MLKKLLLAVSLPTFLVAPSVLAQWDYGQDSVWNSIESRIDIRKTRARMQARRNKNGKSNTRKSSRSSRTKSTRSRRVSTSPRKTANAAQIAAASDSTFPYVFIHRDTFQDFHLDDSKGYSVKFRFVPASGAAIYRTHIYTYYNSRAEFRRLPVGSYKVSGEATYAGRKFPIHVGSEDGSPTDPMGGNFAPTASLKVFWGQDQWGTWGLRTSPESLNVRVIE